LAQPEDQFPAKTSDQMTGVYAISTPRLPDQRHLVLRPSTLHPPGSPAPPHAAQPSLSLLESTFTSSSSSQSPPPSTSTSNQPCQIKSLQQEHLLLLLFLANMNVSSRLLYAIARPSVVCLSVVCNVRATYSGSLVFRQYFYGIRYHGHPKGIH